MIFATAASVSWSFASRRFDSPSRNWIPTATAEILLLFAQLALIFIPSKEEEELSIFRRRLVAPVEQAINEAEEVNLRIQREIQSGNLESAQRWVADHYGK